MNPPTPTVKIWDLPIRLFHWSLVLAILGLYLTAEFSEYIADKFSSQGIHIDVIIWHSRIGYFVLSLLFFRVLWGFWGNDSAKFARLFISMKTVFNYLKTRNVTSKIEHNGHNPLGAYSVFAMLILLFMQVFSGLFADDEIAFTGPLAQYASENFINAMTSWHHINFDLLTLFIGLHIAAIAVYQWLLKERLIRRMITGVELSAATSPNTPVSLVRALTLYIMSVTLVYFIVS